MIFTTSPLVIKSAVVVKYWLKQVSIASTLLLSIVLDIVKKFVGVYTSGYKFLTIPNDIFHTLRFLDKVSARAEQGKTTSMSMHIIENY